MQLFPLKTWQKNFPLNSDRWGPAVNFGDSYHWFAGKNLTACTFQKPQSSRFPNSGMQTKLNCHQKIFYNFDMLIEALIGEFWPENLLIKDLFCPNDWIRNNFLSFSKCWPRTTTCSVHFCLNCFLWFRSLRKDYNTHTLGWLQEQTTKKLDYYFCFLMKF